MADTLPDATVPAPTPDSVRKALRAVKDPELNLNIIDIGLIYGGLPRRNRDHRRREACADRHGRRGIGGRGAGLGALLDAGQDGSPGARIPGVLRSIMKAAA